MKDHYLKGTQATLLQLALYMPDIFLLIGGYVASKSVNRVMEVLTRRDFRDYVCHKRQKLEENKISPGQDLEILKLEEE